MTTFETLFSIKESLVKKTAILLPYFRKEFLFLLGVKGFKKGKLYSSGNSKFFTVIHTGLGPSLLGDAVLYLKDTGCNNIITFGSCGLIAKTSHLNIGDLVVPEESYELEGFTGMLLKNRKDFQSFTPDMDLVKQFLSLDKGNIKKVKCATVGSLKLEESYIDTLKEKDAQVVDMECSSLFSAARSINKKAMALFYITDIIKEKPFYREINLQEKIHLLSSIKSGIKLLCEFTKII